MITALLILASLATLTCYFAPRTDDSFPAIEAATKPIIDPVGTHLFNHHC